MIEHAPQHAKPWSQTRWWGWVAGLFAFQLGLVFLLSSRPSVPAPSTRPPGQVRLLSQPATEPRWIARQWLDDPTELALVSPRGFSGPTWRQLPRLEPGLLSWAETPQWLVQDPARLASTSGPPASGVTLSSLVLANPRPPSEAALPPGTASPLAGSWLRVEGDLAGRRRLDNPDLPAWPYPDVLAPATVQLTVDRDGAVLSATLLTSSGLAAADQRSLELARAARFEPVVREEAPSLTWGQFVFHWQAVPPGTNAP